MSSDRKNLKLKSKRARRALTFVELTIGMAITCITLAALATFVVAVEVGWKRSGDEFRVRNSSSIAVQQMQDVMGSMLYVAQTKTGGTNGSQAYFFFWKTDSWNGVADGKAQFGELALLEYDPVADAVWLYQAKAASSMTAAQKVTAALESGADPTSPALVTYFKSSDIIDTRKAIVGGSSNTATALRVSSATFAYATTSYGKPTARFSLALSSSSGSTTAFGTVTLRLNQSPTNFN